MAAYAPVSYTHLLVEAHAVVGAAIGLIADGELFAVGALQEEAALGLFDRPDDLVVIGGQDAVCLLYTSRCV